MTKDEFLRLVKDGSDIMFKIGNRGFTILAWREGGPDIAEWDKPETAMQFKDAETLVNGYTVNGKPIGEQVDRITIIDYS